MPKSARDTIIEANLHYARRLATQLTLHARPSTPEWQDAFSVAAEALVRCADAFDPTLGVSFLTFAYRSMKNAIIDLRQGERSRWRRETIAHHNGDGSRGGATHTDGGSTKNARDNMLERDEFSADLVPSPEDVLLSAEERIVGQERLSRLSGDARDEVEGILDGEPRRGARVNAQRVAAEVGLKLPSSVAAMPEKMDGATRSARWYSRLTPAQKQKRQDAKNARRRALRAQGVSA